LFVRMGACSEWQNWEPTCRRQKKMGKEKRKNLKPCHCSEEKENLLREVHRTEAKQDQAAKRKMRLGTKKSEKRFF